MPKRKLPVPHRGDIVLVDFDPTLGHEQRGARPALVLSADAFNAFGMAFLAPMTSKVRDNPFYVRVPDDIRFGGGAVLVHQVRMVDWRARNVKRVSRAPADVLHEVVGKLAAVMQYE